MTLVIQLLFLGLIGHKEVQGMVQKSSSGKPAVMLTPGGYSPVPERGNLAKTPLVDFSTFPLESYLFRYTVHTGSVSIGYNPVMTIPRHSLIQWVSEIVPGTMSASIWKWGSVLQGGNRGEFPELIHELGVSIVPSRRSPVHVWPAA